MAVKATTQMAPDELDALTTLEARVVSADGGRLKLEWGVLRERSGNTLRDFLWEENGQLLGFLGLYTFGGAKVEIAGMVDPQSRRRGIATALLEQALPVCREHGGESVLLVVPRQSVGGRALALAREAVLEHSEHALVLTGRPASGPADPRITVRPVRLDDSDAISQLLFGAFGHGLSDPKELLPTNRSRTVVVERDGELAGSMRISRDGDRGTVHGFVIAPELRGHGIGRDVLGRACNELLDAGAAHVALEVAVDNDRALGLYLSLGFNQVATEDYYELTL